jgi:hypothetical protein
LLFLELKKINHTIPTPSSKRHRRISNPTPPTK